MVLLEFVTNRALAGNAAGTIQACLSAIRHYATLAFQDISQFNNMGLLQMMMKAVRKLPRAPVVKRPPITHDILALVIKHIGTDNEDRLMLIAAYTLALQCLMRSGELTVKTHDTQPYLQIKHIAMDLTHAKRYKLIIPWGDKSNRNQLVPINVLRTQQATCPVHAMHQYIHARQLKGTCLPHLPLFMTHRGTPLTAARFSTVLRAVLHTADVPNAEDYGGHSFRRGGATEMAAAGIEDSLIRDIGRWKSYTYQEYIDPTDEARARAVRITATPAHNR